MFLAIASTGRTATSFIAEALNMVTGIAALHEGHLGNDSGPDILPLVNLDNFQCFKSPAHVASVVATKRSEGVIDGARRALGATLLVDVAYYNSVLLKEMLSQMPASRGAIIIRDCESFVRSATWFSGTDPMPVGWPDPAKELDPVDYDRVSPRQGPRWTTRRGACCGAVAPKRAVGRLSGRFLRLVGPASTASPCRGRRSNQESSGETAWPTGWLMR
ncbi:MAG: hypothetical protein EBV24_03805 [Actinobacteria bacterium]|nr:hypothetical protein [Actinomycetota bacterium]